MFHIPIAILIGAACRAASKHAQDKQRKIRDSLMSPEPWTGTIRVPRPLPEVRSAIGEYLAIRGFMAHKSQRNAAHYRRGDTRITRLPFTRKVGWTDVPILLSVGFSKQRGAVIVAFAIGGWPTTRFDKSVESFFREHAEMELDGAVAFLNGGEEPQGGACNRPSPGNGPRDDDMRLLGLKSGFSDEQLRVAFRTACRQFHPDRLVNVEPAVVKLAEEHFSKVRDAYERLRGMAAQPC